MKIRHATVQDAPAICTLVNDSAELGLMLHRSMESLYETLRSFLVAEDGPGRIVGCAAVDVFWADLAEIRSMAVDERCRGKGTGSKLLAAAIKDARALGVKKLFALTYEHEFFVKRGFEVIDRHMLPEKVWRVCMACSKADACDETAVVTDLGDR